MKRFLLFLITAISLVTSYAQHAPGYVDSTYETQSGDGSDWIHNSKTFYYYHPFDTLYYYSITKAWNTATLAYDINQYQDSVTYTGSHKIQQDLQQSWMAGPGIWQNAYLNLYTYDTKNNLTNSTVQDWDATLSVWVNSYQTLIVYDNNNNPTQIESQNWDAGTATWRNSTLLTRSYDGSNRLLQLISQSWSNVNNVWVNVQKTTEQYKSVDTTYELFQNWDAGSNAWINNQEFIHALDALGNTTYGFFFNWNGTTYDTSFVERLAYNTNNQVISFDMRYLSSPSGNSTIYTYDSVGNILSAVSFTDVFQALHSWEVSSTQNSFKQIYTWKLVTDITLPVTLLNFSGQLVANAIRLQWTITSEINSNYFEVQHSLDGNNFEPIGKLAITGNSILIHKYSFTDNAPKLNAINYYRLKQADKDGHFVYSKIIAISFNGTVSVKIYPNPATENIFVDIKGVASGNYHINLTDVSGKTLISKTYSITAGQSLISISLNKYAAGTYFFEMKNTLNQVFTKQKIIKE